MNVSDLGWQTDKHDETMAKVWRQKILSIQIQPKREKMCTRFTWISRDSPGWHTHHFSLFLRCPRQVLEVPPRCLSCLTRCLLLFNSASGRVISRARDRERNKQHGDKQCVSVSVFLWLLCLLEGKQSWDVTSAGSWSETPSNWVWCCRATVSSGEPGKFLHHCRCSVCGPQLYNLHR